MVFRRSGLRCSRSSENTYQKSRGIAAYPERRKCNEDETGSCGIPRGIPGGGGGLYIQSADATSKKAAPALAPKKIKAVKAEECFGCHDKEIKQFHTSGKHAKVNCAYCHDGLEKHLANPGPDTRPATDVSWETCGQCHKEQYDTFMKETYHRPARDEKSQLTGRSPNPYWDKLMMGHGFTKEHNTTRSHDKMLIDQFAVDRAFGGRFQGKNGWQYVLEQGKVLDVLEDKYPNDNEHKPLIPQSAAAANPVCLQCKTQDNILKWAYLGDPDSRKAPPWPGPPTWWMLPGHTAWSQLHLLP